MKGALYGLLLGILLTLSIGVVSAACTENWQVQYAPPVCTDVLQQKYYIDLNDCNTTFLLPVDNNTLVSCTPDNSSNVPGWNDLMAGRPVWAAYHALNEPLGNWLIFILWIIITFVIIARTNSWELSTIIGLIFLTLFITMPWFSGPQIGVAILFMVFQLGVVLFRMAAKEKNL
jgi:hypothetical protein